jgi:hypothetical protein
LAIGVASTSRPRRMGWAVAALACGGLLGAVQLIQSLELTLDGFAQSKRGTAEYASHQAINTVDLARLLVPNVLGNPLCGLPNFDEDNYFHERSGYLGVLPLFLAVFGLTRRSCAGWQWGAAILVLFGLTIALRNQTPLFDLIGYAVPGLTFFRCPGRILSMVTVLLAPLAGRGLDTACGRLPSSIWFGSSPRRS